VTGKSAHSPTVSGVEIPGLGPVTLDDQLGWYVSGPLPVAVLGATCRVAVARYDDDPAKEDFHTVISTFLALDPSVLRAAESSIFEYYQDETAAVIAGNDWDWYVEIPRSEDVWQHIEIGPYVHIERDHHDDRRIYVSVECECDWEVEHGLQIVFREGRYVSKVGPYDGHPTNPNGVVYRRH